MLKKVWFGIACLIGLLFLVLAGYYAYQWQGQQATKTVLKKERGKAEQSFENLKLTSSGQSYYLSPDGSGTVISDEMKTWNDLSLRTQEVKKTDFIILRPETQKTDLKGVKKLRIHQVVYQRDFFEFKQKSSRILREFHIKEDQSVFSLDDLFNGNANCLKEEMTDLYPEAVYKVPDPMADFEEKGMASDGFDYKESQLLINAEFQIPVANLFDVVDANYLNDIDLAAYTAYQEQKEAEERARQEEAAKEAEAKKYVALTFDDGPNGQTTPQVLEALKKHNAKATFFVLGSNVAGNESILQRMVAEGHEIGNHSWDHPNLTSLSTEQVKAQVSNTNQAVEAAAGVCPKIIRPPYGASNASVQAAVGMPQILWSVDTLDWQSRNTKAILGKVKEQTRAGGVILMHDIHKTTADALPTVLDYLSSQGYQFVTVSQLYGL